MQFYSIPSMSSGKSPTLVYIIVAHIARPREWHSVFSPNSQERGYLVLSCVDGFRAAGTRYGHVGMQDDDGVRLSVTGLSPSLSIYCDG